LIALTALAQRVQLAGAARAQLALLVEQLEELVGAHLEQLVRVDAAEAARPVVVAVGVVAAAGPTRQLSALLARLVRQTLLALTLTLLALSQLTLALLAEALLALAAGELEVPALTGAAEAAALGGAP
jgi:hypothetical protein